MRQRPGVLHLFFTFQHKHEHNETSRFSHCCCAWQSNLWIRNCMPRSDDEKAGYKRRARVVFILLSRKHLSVLCICTFDCYDAGPRCMPTTCLNHKVPLACNCWKLEAGCRDAESYLKSAVCKHHLAYRVELKHHCVGCVYLSVHAPASVCICRQG